tara:strand:- start:297 stop:524 length:228 start_codon:yes stop_codon:yes gene_type:complete
MMKDYTEITERLSNELKFLDEEGKSPIVIAEAALKAAMVYTIARAPNSVLGIQLISKALHDVVCVAAEQSLTKEK